MILSLFGIKGMKMINSLLKRFMFLNLSLDLLDISLNLNLKLLDIMGSMHQKKHKLYDSCRKLINNVKIPILSSFNKWQLLLMKSFNVNPLKCDICGNVLKYERSYIY